MKVGFQIIQTEMIAHALRNKRYFNSYITFKGRGTPTHAPEVLHHASATRAVGGREACSD